MRALFRFQFPDSRAAPAILRIMSLAFFEPRSFLFLEAYARTLFSLAGGKLTFALVVGLFLLLMGAAVARLSAAVLTTALGVIVAGSVAQTQHESFAVYVGGASALAMIVGLLLPRLSHALWNGATLALVARTFGVALGGGEFAFEIFWSGFFFAGFLSLLLHRFSMTVGTSATGAFVATFVGAGLTSGTLGLDIDQLYAQRTVFAGAWASLMMVGVGVQLWIGPIDRDRVVAKWLSIKAKLGRKKRAPSKAKSAAKPTAKRQ